MSGQPAGTLKRRDVYPGALVDGRPAPNGTAGRLRRQLQRLLVSQGEREEAELERRIRTQPGVTRPNTVALISPKGGVGKTTSTFLVGQPARHPPQAARDRGRRQPRLRHARAARARTIADAPRSLADLLDDADRLNTAAELAPLRLAPADRAARARRAPRRRADREPGPDRYGELVAFLACFYEVVLLDLGTGVAGPLARFAIERADQVVLVTTPEWVTSTVVLDALSHLQHDRTTVALNKSLLRAAAVARDRGALPRRASAPRRHDPLRRPTGHHARQRHLHARRAQAPDARSRSSASGSPSPSSSSDAARATNHRRKQRRERDVLQSPERDAHGRRDRPPHPQAAAALLVPAGRHRTTELSPPGQPPAAVTGASLLRRLGSSRPGAALVARPFGGVAALLSSRLAIFVRCC